MMMIISQSVRHGNSTTAVLFKWYFQKDEDEIKKKQEQSKGKIWGERKHKLRFDDDIAILTGSEEQLIAVLKVMVMKYAHGKTNMVLG